MTLEKLIRTGAAALGVLAIASQAYAADIYSGGGGLKDAPIAPPPPPLWAGFYAGIHLGAAWVDHNNDHNKFYDRYRDGVSYYDHSYEDPIYYSNGWDYGGNGDNQTTAFGGGQFGYNWTPYGWTGVVLGIEVDIDGLGNNNERTFIGNTYGDTNPSSTPILTGINTVTVKREGGFAGDVTGRLGWTWGPALIYAKGGFAWLESKLKVHATSYDPTTGTYATFSSGNGDWNNDNTLTGWTVGGGVEWLVSPSWSVKLEYLHFDFTSDDHNWNPSLSYDGGATWNNYNNWRFRNDLTADTVKLGVNYHLNSGYQQAPLK
jgi:outer membrane immunogenic protein